MNKAAILNEYKGKLFEYLIAKEIAIIYGIESEFTTSIQSQHFDLLTTYETELKKIDFDLPLKLIGLAQQGSKCIIRHLQNMGILKILKIELVGQAFNEADILLTLNILNSKTEEIYLSLKLAKDQSFINTKSAGSQSFIQKYLPVPNRFKYQNDFNHFVYSSFEQMKEELYQEAEIDRPYNFGGEWTTKYSKLPGELPLTLQLIVRKHYERVNLFLSKILEESFIQNKAEFIFFLKKVAGFKNEKNWQCYVFHENHEFKNALVYEITNLGLHDLTHTIIKMNTKSHAIEFSLPFDTLQLRLKPMREFTSPSYKINCSLKKNKGRAFFLDRDGIINEDSNYLFLYEKLKWVDGIIEFICELNQLGFIVCVLTNQSGIARGYFTSKDVEKLHLQMNSYLLSKGARVDGWYYSSELDESAERRKPNPGMAIEAANDFNLDLKKSYMLGDKISDVLKIKLKKVFLMKTKYELNVNDIKTKQSVIICNNFDQIKEELKNERI